MIRLSSKPRFNPMARDTAVSSRVRDKKGLIKTDPRQALKELEGKCERLCTWHKKGKNMRIIAVNPGKDFEEAAVRVGLSTPRRVGLTEMHTTIFEDALKRKLDI